MKTTIYDNLPHFENKKNQKVIQEKHNINSLHNNSNNKNGLHYRHKINDLVFLCNQNHYF